MAARCYYHLDTGHLFNEQLPLRGQRLLEHTAPYRPVDVFHNIKGQFTQITNMTRGTLANMKLEELHFYSTEI